MRILKISIWNITRESLVHKHLWFLEDDELLVDEQNGFKGDQFVFGPRVDSKQYNIKSLVVVTHVQ